MRKIPYLLACCRSGCNLPMNHSILPFSDPLFSMSVLWDNGPMIWQWILAGRRVHRSCREEFTSSAEEYFDIQSPFAQGQTNTNNEKMIAATNKKNGAPGRAGCAAEQGWSASSLHHKGLLFVRLSFITQMSRVTHSVQYRLDQETRDG